MTKGLSKKISFAITGQPVMSIIGNLVDEFTCCFTECSAPQTSCQSRRSH